MLCPSACDLESVHVLSVEKVGAQGFCILRLVFAYCSLVLLVGIDRWKIGRFSSCALIPKLVLDALYGGLEWLCHVLEQLSARQLLIACEKCSQGFASFQKLQVEIEERR